jgi:hypothetical protein
MEDQRDPNPNNLSNQTNSSHTMDTNSEDPRPRPTKVQKTTMIPVNQASCSINIPTFMGPIPTINYQNNTGYLPYTQPHLQNEEDQGQNQHYKHHDSPRNYQESPRSSQGNKDHNNNATRPNGDPFCMYKEEHVEEGVHLCNNTLIGKILSNKVILKPVLYNSLQGIWGYPLGLTVTEVEGGYYHISMDSVLDI